LVLSHVNHFCVLSKSGSISLLTATIWIDIRRRTGRCNPCKTSSYAQVTSGHFTLSPRRIQCGPRRAPTHLSGVWPSQVPGSIMAATKWENKRRLRVKLNRHILSSLTTCLKLQSGQQDTPPNEAVTILPDTKVQRQTLFIFFSSSRREAVEDAHRLSDLLR